jgi:DNA polymerase (family 10)
MADARATIAAKPDWAKRLQGDLQMHSVWSDGSGTIADMAEAAQERGYAYIAITDHSKGLKIAGGINEPQLRQQVSEIRARW